MLWRYVLAWVPMPFIGIINGIIRQYGYKNLVGELTAHQISCFTGIILFGLYVWLLTLKWRIVSAGQALGIGGIWLSLTVSFEFLFGHFVMKNPWSTLLHDYNILEGRLWLFVLVFITLAPLTFFKLRSR
ncbi:hypothetical protein ACFLT2_03740 [Acidobacteriota bacterium]